MPEPDIRTLRFDMVSGSFGQGVLAFVKSQLYGTNQWQAVPLYIRARWRVRRIVVMTFYVLGCLFSLRFGVEVYHLG